METALNPRTCGRGFEGLIAAKSLENKVKITLRSPISNTVQKTPSRSRSKAAFKPLRLEPVARSGRGASIPESFAVLEASMAARGPGYICFTILWQRVLRADQLEMIPREQAALIHRLRRVLARRGHRNVLIFSVLERTAKHGLHGHVLAESPVADEHEEILDAVEEGLIRCYGRLRSRAFRRDGWHRGSIRTAQAALGALRYRLKSLPSEPIEHGVRRGLGLLPVAGISIKASRGRTLSKEVPDHTQNTLNQKNIVKAARTKAILNFINTPRV